MLRDMLRQEGTRIGRLHVATLMERMAIESIYCRLNTSKPAPGQARLWVMPPAWPSPGLHESGFHRRTAARQDRLSHG